MTIIIENEKTGKKTEFYNVPYKVASGIKALLCEAEKNDSPIIGANLESDEYYKKIMKAPLEF